MKKQIFFVIYFLVTINILAQEKIPFVNIDNIINEADKSSQSNDYKSSVKALNKINRNDSLYCSVLVLKSYYLLNSNEYEKTIKTADEGLNLGCYDSGVSLLINKGLAYLYLEKHDKALDIYDEALKQYPNNYLLWYNKGFVLEKKGKTKEAVEAYKKTITFNPIYAKPHLQLGNICYKQGLNS